MRYLAIKNFERFQHYRNRAPLWIKLYTGLLDDFDFLALPELARLHLIMLWLVASRNNNRLPDDPKMLAQSIKAKGRVDIKLLVQAGFLVYQDSPEPLAIVEHSASNLLAETEHDASPHARPRAREELERETETEHTLSARVRDGLGESLPEPHQQTAVVAFLLAVRPAQREAWFARFPMWLAGHDFPSHTQCTPDLLATALREYVDQPGDFSAAHVKDFVLRAARQAARGTSTSAASLQHSRAKELFQLFLAHGFTRARSRDELTAAVKALAADGTIADPRQFWRELEAVKPWTWLGSVRTQDEARAITRIAEAIAA